MIKVSMMTLFFAALSGLALSIILERMMRPRPRFLRPLASWSLHIGIWLLVYGLLALVLGRPWFSMTVTTVLFLILVQVNNAKMHSLREPFVYQDYEYFTDAIRHPRLYIPFFGWGKFFIAVAGGAIAIGIGLWGEPLPPDRWSLNGYLGTVLILTSLALVLVAGGHYSMRHLSIDPVNDLIRLGFVASLWAYSMASRQKPDSSLGPFNAMPSVVAATSLPHMLVVQSESFFDPRPLFDGIRKDILASFDSVKKSSLLHGKLNVPAWGANTVRSEFSFLTGIDEKSLGVHRFNPYRAISAGWHVSSIASYLKQLGYRTICIHPYPGSFYSRDIVYPLLGFDEFLDISVFDGVALTGPYIGDIDVATKISELLSVSTQPIFIYAITMENHGPLHLEDASEVDTSTIYDILPPEGTDDLTVYLRHLRNADRMISQLTNELKELSRPSGLCWFGDHVPIMPEVYEIMGFPSGEVDYLVWYSEEHGTSTERSFKANQLATEFLKVMRLMT